MRALADSLDRDWMMNNYNNSEHYRLFKLNEDKDTDTDQEDTGDDENQEDN